MQEIATVLKGAASLHGHVPGHLLHPSLVRVNGDPGNVHLAALEVNEKQHVVGHQSAQREDLRREEVGPRQHRQVSQNECRPGGRVLALRRGRQTVALQNIADRLIRDLMPQIGQRPHNPIITPGPILLGHANNQFLNFSVDPWPARGSPFLRAIELAGDEPSVPCQDGVRQGGSRHLAECLAAQSTANLAKLRSLCVRELQPPLQLAPQNPVFSSQIFVPQQQLLVHRPGDVGQDACPLHASPPFARRSTMGTTDRSKKRSRRCAARPRSDEITTRLSCSFNFLTLRAGAITAWPHPWAPLRKVSLWPNVPAPTRPPHDGSGRNLMSCAARSTCQRAFMRHYAKSHTRNAEKSTI